MKAVLMSIQPKWCELIASGKKTIEVRKTKPKLPVPFKVYIYMTKSYDTLFGYGNPKKLCVDGGKVIGEFICDEIREYNPYKWREGGFEGLNYKYNPDLCDESCLSQDELMKYGRRKKLYGWHISDLKIYDEPKELSEFRLYDVRAYYDVELRLPMPTHEISRPPQSWCYVKELQGCLR